MNPINPNQIFDFAALESKLKAAETAFAQYSANSSKAIDVLNKRIESTKDEIQELIGVLKATGRGTGSGIGENLEGLTALTEEYKSSIIETDGAIKKLKKTKEALKKDIEALKNTQNAESAQVKELENRYTSVSAKINTLTQSMKAANRATENAVGSYNRLQAELTKDIAKLKALGGTFDTSTGKTNKLNAETEKLVRSIRAKTEALKKFDKELGQNHRNVGNYAGSIVSVIRNIGSVAASFYAAQAALQNFYSVALKGDEMERLSISIENVSTSQGAFAYNMQFLSVLSQDLGVDIEDLRRSFIGFQGSIQGTSLEGQKGIEIFQAITKASTAMALSQEQTGRVMRAFTQMISKGTVNSEELKQQLGDSLPQALRIFAAAMGVSREELFKLMEQNKVFAADVLPDVADKLNEAFGEKAKRNLETLSGAQAQLNSTWKEFLESDTKGIRTFLVFVLNTVNYLISQMGGQINKFIKGNRVAARDEIMDGQIIAAGKSLKYSEALIKASLKKREELQIAYQKTTDYHNKKGLELEIKALNEHILKLADIRKQHIDTATLSEEEASKKAQKIREEQEKASQAAAEKAASAELQKNKKQYQIRLRSLSADLKAQEDAINISYEQRLIDIETRDRELLDVRQAHNHKELDLINEFSAKSIKLEEELTDDRHRNQAESMSIMLENAKSARQQLNNMYESILRDFNQSSKLFDASYETSVRSGLDNIDRDMAQKFSQSAISPNSIDFALFGDTNELLEAEIQIEGLLRKIELIESEYTKAQIGITKEYEKAVKAIVESGDSQLEQQKRLLELEEKYRNESADITRRNAEDIAEYQKQLEEEKTDFVIKQLERETDARVHFASQIQSTYEELYSILNTLSNGFMDIYSRRIENEITLLDRRKEHELESVGTSEEGRRKIEQEYEKKRIEAQRRRDRMEKLTAIFGILLKNQEAKMAALTAKSPIEAIARYGFANIQGKIALGIAVGTPLPEYAKGKKENDPYQGFAIVGEKGREIVNTKEGSRLVSEPSIMWLNRGDVVHSNTETEKILKPKEQRERIGDKILEGFKNASITINNEDGSVTLRKYNSLTRNVTKKRYA